MLPTRRSPDARRLLVVGALLARAVVARKSAGWSCGTGAFGGTHLLALNEM
jgi:hypothetical protein